MTTNKLIYKVDGAFSDDGIGREISQFCVAFSKKLANRALRKYIGPQWYFLSGNYPKYLVLHPSSPTGIVAIINAAAGITEFDQLLGLGLSMKLLFHCAVNSTSNLGRSASRVMWL